MATVKDEYASAAAKLKLIFKIVFNGFDSQNTLNNTRTLIPSEITQSVTKEYTPSW